VLDFEIDPATQRGAQAALSVLRQVSAERIQSELFKILQSANVMTGLRLIKDFGISDVCLPELPELPDAGWKHLIKAIDHIQSDVITSLTLIFHAYQKHIHWSKLEFATQVKSTLKRLKVNNRALSEVLHLITFTALDPRDTRSDAQIRALAAEIGIEALDQVWAYHEAWLRSSVPSDQVSQLLSAWSTLRSRMDNLQVQNSPQSVRDLAINGNDLCSALDLFPSKDIGDLLKTLLRWVWEDPVRNHRDLLLYRARVVALERGMIKP
jgi:tRNA nucleotidyltransferase/poly(A) polymerase